MLQIEVLIFELGAIDWLATSAVVVGEVATLTHETGNDSMENWAFVTETLFASAQSTEVLGSSWNNIRSELAQNKKFQITQNGQKVQVMEKSRKGKERHHSW